MTHLLDGTLCLEKNAAAQQLPEDAADGPYVDRLRVVACPHQELRRTVVLGHHLLGHVFAFVRLLHSRQPEVADLVETKLWVRWRTVVFF